MRPSGEPTAGPSPPLRVAADRFIPVRASELAEALAQDAGELGAKPAALRRVFAAVREITAIETAALERAMSDLYALFNPDRDTIPLRPLDTLRTPEAYDEFECRVGYLFEKANFERLTQAEVAAAIREANTHGLRIKIRPEMVEELNIWMRGRGTITRNVWSWRSPRKGCPKVHPVYKQLAVMARLKGEPGIYLKLFRDIPIADVEALLPHAEVRMSWWDRTKVLGGGAGAFGGVALKLAQGALTLAYLSSLIWVALAALGIMAFRTFFGFRKTKKVRDGERNRHLYYRNVANNAGVLSWLIDMIGQEEEKEALLGYAMCIRGCDDLDKLRERVSEYLGRRFGGATAFDSPDAAETMDRLGLWAERSSMRVIDPDEACRRLGAESMRATAIAYHDGKLRVCRVPGGPR